ncbi:MAG: MbnP family protein [Saprospiraceae bacterium]|nr:MbnP family protein [Saprospiraceae bacterium]
MKIKMSFFALLSVLLAFTACDENQEEFNINDKGSITLEFDNIVGGQDLQLDKGAYTNASGEQFSINLFQYYISNIKLKTEDGREYIVPQDESYFLVREHEASSHEITLNNVPAGNYTEVSFVIGVDSLRNTMDPSKRTGVLDIGDEATGKGMYWSWNSGYIFVRIEGTSPQSPQVENGQNIFFYHVGGFGGYSAPTINNIRNKTLTFGKDAAEVRKDKAPSVHILVDAMKIFDGGNTISIAANPFSHFTTFSAKIADNYVSMFTYDHVHND